MAELTPEFRLQAFLSGLDTLCKKHGVELYYDPETSCIVVSDRHSTDKSWNGFNFLGNLSHRLTLDPPSDMRYFT